MRVFFVALAGMVDSFFGGETLYQLFFREEEIIATGAGDTMYTAMASTISVTSIRTAASYIFGL